MKAQYPLLTLLLATLIQSGFAQNSTDAFRFSSYDILGSARFVSLGGAMGSIGGDLSTLNYNPAGLGIFQSSEMNFSPAIQYSANEALYNNQLGLDSKVNLNHGLLGMVGTYRLPQSEKTSGWKAINYGISINRTKNFHNTMYISGESFNSSLANVWRDMANGSCPEDLQAFSTGLAWDAYILDTIPGDPSHYYSNAPLGGVIQTYMEDSKGYINELSFAMSANYNDKLLLGFSLGIPSLSFQRQIKYNEYSIYIPESYEFDEFTYTEDLLTKGTGINAKIGLIYIISPAIRINAAYHTPTYYGNLVDEYYAKIESLMGDGNAYSSESPIGNMAYQLSTPSRTMAGLSFFIQKKGFISLDYEYMDYSKSYLSSSTYSFANENSDIRTDFRATHNFRIGAEWRLDALSFRTGYNIISSPMNPEVNDIISYAYSWGLGYRIGNTYFDFAALKRKTDNSFYMYNPDYVNPASITNTTNNYIFTVGYKF